MKINNFEDYLIALSAAEQYKKSVIDSAKLKKGTILRYKGELGMVDYVGFNEKDGSTYYKFKPSSLYDNYLYSSSEKRITGDEEGLEVLEKNPVEEFADELNELQNHKNLDSKAEEAKAMARLSELQKLCAHEWDKDGGIFSKTTLYWCTVCGKKVGAGE